MKWGLTIALGVIGIGLTLWDIATRQPLPPKSPIDPNMVRRSPAPPPGPPQIPRARALACGLREYDLDWRDAERWVNKYLPPGPLLSRLNLMRSMVPFPTWPLVARRVWCAYVDPGAIPVEHQVAQSTHSRWGV